MNSLIKGLYFPNRESIFDALDGALNEMFDKRTTNFLKNDFGLDLGKHSFPKIDVIDTQKGLVLYADLPSYSKDDIDIQYLRKDEILSICSNSERKLEYDELKEENSKFIRKEIKRSKFIRQFSISNEIYNCENISSKFEN